MLETAIEKLNKEAVKLSFYLLIVSCFWGFSFYIVKPDIFIQPLQVQFFILFCISFIWCFVGSLLGILLESIFIKSKVLKKDFLLHIRTELYLLFSIFVKSIFIFFAYYYTLNITEYLQFIFKWVLILILILLVISSQKLIKLYK